MKVFKIITFVLLGAFVFASCEDDDKTIYNPDLAEESALVTPLSPNGLMFTEDDADELINFSWSATDPKVSVQIDYEVQLASEETFENVITLGSVTSGTELDVLVSAINNALISLEYETDVEATVYSRVVATINDNVEQIEGNVLSYSVTPYQTSFPPLYMVGDATGGWDWSSDVIVPSSQPNVYTTLVHFTNAGAFRFFAQRDWGPTSYNYPYFADGTVSNLFEDAMDGDNNFRFIGTTGWYRVTVNLKDLTVDMEEVDEPTMYMTGAAVGGWDWTDNYVKMDFVQEGVWTASTDFVSGEAFRFFAQADWGPDSYNYPYFSDGSVSNLFEDALDGDNNFRFIGTTGDFKITVNFNDLTVTME